MPRYDIALVVTIEADNYGCAELYAEALADGIGQEGEDISAVLNYEHDNEGQRIVYLHPEDESF